MPPVGSRALASAASNVSGETNIAHGRRPVRRLGGGSPVRAQQPPPPSPWVETFVNLLAFIAPEWGLFALASVSAGSLCLAEGPVCGLVSALIISVPRSSGDRFDDWAVGHQLEPTVSTIQPLQTAHFRQDADRSFLRGLSATQFSDLVSAYLGSFGDCRGAGRRERDPSHCPRAWGGRGNGAACDGRGSRSSFTTGY
jgi:hypothetical protein